MQALLLRSIHLLGAQARSKAMGTAESLLYYDEGGGGDVQGSVTEDRTGSGGSSSSSNQPASLHRAPSPSAGSTRPPPPSSIPPARDENTSGPSSRQRRDIGEARRQGNGGNKNEQSPPLSLRGYVIGSSSTGKTSLVRRLRGENPFAEDADVAGAGAKQQQHKQRPQRKRKMMALVPWRDRQSGQNCQLHVVEKTSDDAAQTAHDVAMEALGDHPDFCICMVDPRSESSVEFAKTAIDALLNAPLDNRPSSSSSRRTTSNTNTSHNNLIPLDRPNICVLINYMDFIKIVDSASKEDDGDDNDDGLYRMTQTRLMDICAEIIELQKNRNGANIGPSIQIYPSSMVSCSGLTSLHSFIMLPYMRKEEVRLLQQLEHLHRSHNKSMAALRDGGVKAMQQAIDEGKARMSAAPPVSSGRRSIIQLQKGRGNVGASSKPAAAGWEKRVRIDETRNTNHFEGDEPPLPPESTSSVQRHDDIDEMTQRLQEADQARRRRRQQALGGEKSTSEDGTAKRSSSAKQESSSSGRRSIISSKQRDAMQDAISKVPTPLKQKQQEKQMKNIAADPMKALEDFLGSDSDSDMGGEPVRSTVGSASKDGESDNDDSSSGGSSSDTDGNDEGPRPSILLSDSDSEDDDYDEGGHAHYSHLDDRLKKPSAEEEVDEKSASEQVESETEGPVASGDVETPPKKRDSKTLRSNHDEEEKKDESPSGRSYAVDEEASSDPSSPRVEEEGADRVNVGGDSFQEGSNQEILHIDDEASVSTPIVDSKQSENKVDEVKSADLDSKDESVVGGAELARPEILHSDDEDSAGREQSPDPTPAVEILHSDDDDEDEDDDEDDEATKQAAVEILHSDDEESNRELESMGIESPNNEVQVLDSEDESPIPLAADRPTDILHSDDDNDDDVRPSSTVSLSDRPPLVNNSGDDSESSQVEILHSDEEEDGDEVPLKPSEPVVSASIDGDEEDEQQTEESEQAAPSIDNTVDSEPPVGSSSSNVLVEALQPNDTDDEPEVDPETPRLEEPASTGMSAAVAAALAAAEEEARRMMQATVIPSGVEEERRKKKKKSKDGKKSKKSAKSADGEGKKTKKKKKSRRSCSVEDS